MNPSRISTPVRKLIDTWHFKFNQFIVRYEIYLERPRDAQANASNADPKISFYAALNHGDLNKAGIKSAAFTFTHLAHANINHLRKMCEEQIRELLHLDWHPVIIVGFKVKGSQGDSIFESNREPAVDMTFDYTPAEQAASYYRLKGTPDTGLYYTRPCELLHGFCFDKDCVHVLPYKESYLASLGILKAKYDILNQRISELVQPGQVESLLERINLLLT
jgi:hypothetical protein